MTFSVTGRERKHIFGGDWEPARTQKSGGPFREPLWESDFRKGKDLVVGVSAVIYS